MLPDYKYFDANLFVLTRYAYVSFRQNLHCVYPVHLYYFVLAISCYALYKILQANLSTIYICYTLWKSTVTDAIKLGSFCETQIALIEMVQINKTHTHTHTHKHTCTHTHQALRER